MPDEMYKTPTPAEAITDKPVKVPETVIHTANAIDKISTKDKISTNKVWIGTKHFLYGFSIAATASIVAGAHPYLALGLGVAGGIAEATRKVAKEAAAGKGSDWADILDKVLAIIMAVIEAMKKKKEVAK